MFHKIRITVVGLLLVALASAMVQASPLIPQSRPAQRVEAGDLLALAMDWLAARLGAPRAPVDRGTATGTVGHGQGSSTLQEKEGSHLDPNGLH